MAATAAVRKKFFFSFLFLFSFNISIQAGQEFLKRTWGEDQLTKVNALLDARDEPDAKPKAKPKLSKARTMQNTTKVD